MQREHRATSILFQTQPKGTDRHIAFPIDNQFIYSIIMMIYVNHQSVCFQFSSFPISPEMLHLLRKKNPANYHLKMLCEARD